MNEALQSHLLTLQVLQDLDRFLKCHLISENIFAIINLQIIFVGKWRTFCSQWCACSCPSALIHLPLVPHICISELSQHWFRSAPSHYLNQRWVSVNWTRRNKFQWIFNQNIKLFIQGSASENIVREMAAILSKERWVKFSMIVVTFGYGTGTLRTNTNCRIWSWSPVPCEKHGPRDSVDKNRGRRPRFLSLLRPEVFSWMKYWLLWKILKNALLLC